MKWTDEQIKRVGQMLQNGKTFSEVADVLKTTRSAIASLCRRKNLREVPVSKTEHVLRSVAGRKKSPPAKQEAPRPDLNAIFVPLNPGTVGGAGRAVLNLKPHSCRWPIGDPRDTKFRFCCEKRDFGAPYCKQHQLISRVPHRT